MRRKMPFIYIYFSLSLQELKAIVKEYTIYKKNASSTFLYRKKVNEGKAISTFEKTQTLALSILDFDLFSKDVI